MLALAAAVGGGWWWWSQQKKRPLRAAALPPQRPATRSDRLLADLINAQDADMRSIELGVWAVNKLRAHVMSLNVVDCGTVAEGVPYDSIAGEIPNINPVAKAETARLLKELVLHASAQCKGLQVTPATFAATLDMYKRSAFHPTVGLLWGMNGYAARSPRRLPRL